MVGENFFHNKISGLLLCEIGPFSHFGRQLGFHSFVERKMSRESVGNGV